MKAFPLVALCCLIALSSHSMEPFQEQVPLQMATPNINKEQPTKWIPLTSNPKEAVTKSTSTSSTSINELIKTQIQKKMQTLLKPVNDDQDEH